MRLLSDCFIRIIIKHWLLCNNNCRRFRICRRYCPGVILHYLGEKDVFRSLASFRVYLYNSVRNASLDYLKHKDVEGNYLQKMLDSHSTTFRMEEEEEGFFSEEVYRQLLQTIDALPDRCKEVFLMYMEGKKNEEIATALHVSLETVKTQKKRAMSFLRKKLGSYHFLLLQMLLP